MWEEGHRVKRSRTKSCDNCWNDFEPDRAGQKLCPGCSQLESYAYVKESRDEIGFRW